MLPGPLEDFPPDPEHPDVVPLERSGIANDYNVDLDDGYSVDPPCSQTPK